MRYAGNLTVKLNYLTLGKVFEQGRGGSGVATWHYLIGVTEIIGIG